MTKKKTELQETMTTIVIDEEPQQTEINEASTDLPVFKEIMSLEGVLGYIRKDESTATVNLKDPKRTSEYALLATTVFEAAEKMRGLFNWESTQNAIVECGALKIFCFFVGENMVSVFMDKTADPAKVAAAIKNL